MCDLARFLSSSQVRQLCSLLLSCVFVRCSARVFYVFCYFFLFICLILSFFFFFFFSSRRRHTRSTRDWSSDVCSSDLFTYRETIAGSIRSSSSFCFKSFWNSPTGINSLSNPRRADTAVRRKLRSEERRVGKECRSRWEADHQKKKSERNTNRTSITVTV